MAASLAAGVATCGQRLNTSFHSIPSFPLDESGPVLRANTDPFKPFTVTGEHGALLGRQDGTYEAWIRAVKILSHFSIQADMQGYNVPIDLNQHAATIEVRPDHTVITYAHIGFTVRQIMFSPDDASAGTGPVVIFQFDCLRPTDFTLRFTPELRWMWPQRNEGKPNVDWVAPGPNPQEVAGGFYVLKSDYPDLAAAVTIPGARAGILAPYQEAPQAHPAELKLHIDPARDNGKLFPLLMAVGTNPQSASTAALQSTLEKLNQNIATIYAQNAKAWGTLLSRFTYIETPDRTLNEAFQWAVISIEQLRTKTVSGDETALVAGYGPSGDSTRPGYGWFFGRDALYSLYAVHGYGNFPLARSELEFLIHRQRADGKIMHEYSQTSAAVDWQQFPYEYAAADSTPLFLLAVLDYVRSSGDIAFLATQREAIQKAWEFETGHSDPNGIYANTQGTGWVESWPGGMPRQEIYLALLDQQASAAMAQIYDLFHDAERASAARTRAAAVAKTINRQFFDQEKGCYAFSHNTDDTLDHTATVYPSLAWWSDLEGAGTLQGKGSILEHPDPCLHQFAAHALNTDWGLRDVSNEEKFYDGMSYHQGSVWPLFTGWAAMAEYRGANPLAGYRALMENANLTRAQDLGAITELLSGDFNVPVGRSSPHQMWSSAMVITPTLRGLFGIDVDAQTKTITVNPSLPATWDHATVRNLATGNSHQTLSFTRSGDTLEVRLADPEDGWKLRSDVAGSHSNQDAAALRIPFPEVELSESIEPPLPGARTEHARVLSETHGSNSLTLTFEGMAGSNAEFAVIRHRALPHLHLDSPPDRQSAGREPVRGTAQLNLSDAAKKDPSLQVELQIHFPEGKDWETVTVTLTW